MSLNFSSCTEIQTYGIPLKVSNKVTRKNETFSPLIHENKLAVDGVAGDVFRGFDADVAVHGLRDDVRM